MKIWIKFLLGITLSLCCAFSCVGYAAISGSLAVQGEVDVAPPKSVYITSVSTSGKNGGVAEVNNFSLTVLNSYVRLANRKNSTATFTITVYNNSDVVQGYNAMIYTVGDATYDNENIVLNPDIKRRTAINPGEFLTFNVTASFVTLNQGVTANYVLNSIVNYEFLPIDQIPEDEGEVAVLNVLEKFKKILNDAEDYKTLSDEIAANYDGSRDWTATYIGNVVGTEDYENNNDTAIVNDLFDGVLTLNINGVDTSVTVIIKREEIDGNSSTGDTYYYGTPSRGVADTEMTLYITAEDLNSVNSGTHVTVYAIVFTINQDASGNPTGEWYQVGEMYTGTAQVVGYIGGYNNGSFDTGTWRKTGTNQTIQSIIQSLD